MTAPMLVACGLSFLSGITLAVAFAYPTSRRMDLAAYWQVAFYIVTHVPHDHRNLGCKDHGSGSDWQKWRARCRCLCLCVYTCVSCVSCVIVVCLCACVCVVSVMMINITIPKCDTDSYKKAEHAAPFFAPKIRNDFGIAGMCSAGAASAQLTMEKKH